MHHTRLLPIKTIQTIEQNTLLSVKLVEKETLQVRGQSNFGPNMPTQTTQKIFSLSTSRAKSALILCTI